MSRLAIINGEVDGKEVDHLALVDFLEEACVKMETTYPTVTCINCDWLSGSIGYDLDNLTAWPIKE